MEDKIEQKEFKVAWEIQTWAPTNQRCGGVRIITASNETEAKKKFGKTFNPCKVLCTQHPVSYTLTKLVVEELSQSH